MDWLKLKNIVNKKGVFNFDFNFSKKKKIRKWL